MAVPFPTRRAARPSRWAAAAAAVAVALLASPHAHASARPSLRLPARPPALTEALHLVERARPALQSGTLSEAVTAAAQLGGIVLRVPTVDGFSGDLTAAASGAAGIAAALARSMHISGELAQAAVDLDDADVTLMQSQTYALLDAALADPRSPGLTQRAAVLEARVRAGVDRQALYQAALMQAAAIDAALPALQSAAAAIARPAGTISGCDVVDQAPHVCVAGTGDNIIAREYALVVDLGGDDLHRHAAGGAAPTVNGFAAAVTLDLGGNDRYESTLSNQRQAAQGTGRTGGVGFLVDVAGADVYRTSAVRAEAPESDLINAQGAAVAGVGVLADFGGDDRYELENSVGGRPGNGAQGLGTGVLGGMALALDRGGSQDTATVTGAPSLATGDEGGVRISATRSGAFGNGAGASVAVYADDGGADVLRVHAAPQAAAADALVEQAGTSIVQGFGYGGLGGVGLALIGAGNQHLSALGTVRSPIPAQVSSGVFGWVAFGGLAGAVDAGGDDRYEVRLRSQAQVHRHLADCACDEVSAESGAVSASGMGNGVLAGIGFLRDLGGNDRYLVEAVSEAAVTTEGSGAATRAPVVAATGGSARALVQGSGAAGVGLIEDVGGDDEYEAGVRSEAAASTRDGAGSQLVHAVAGEVDTMSQGAGWGDFNGLAPGYGELRDAGGKDRYDSDARARATTLGESTDDPGTGGVQASARTNGTGALVDVDGGLRDVFSAFPAVPACMGTRGEDVWRDCGEAAAVGVNR